MYPCTTACHLFKATFVVPTSNLFSTAFCIANPCDSSNRYPQNASHLLVLVPPINVSTVHGGLPLCLFSQMRFWCAGWACWTAGSRDHGITALFCFSVWSHSQGILRKVKYRRHRMSPQDACSQRNLTDGQTREIYRRYAVQHELLVFNEDDLFCFPIFVGRLPCRTSSVQYVREHNCRKKQ